MAFSDVLQSAPSNPGTASFKSPGKITSLSLNQLGAALVQEGVAVQEAAVKGSGCTA